MSESPLRRDLPKPQCDLCNEDLTHPDTFIIDGTIRVVGERPRWGNYCVPCYIKYGRGFGTGIGMLFRRREDGYLTKLAQKRKEDI